MEGFVLVGYLLVAQLCQLDASEKPIGCKALPPMRRGGSAECEASMQTVAASFPSMEPEAFGFPAGTRLHINLKCAPLYGPFSA